MLTRPIAVTATSVVPDALPIDSNGPKQFRYNGRQLNVTDSAGPERIETGWWRGSHVRRDYYRVTTDDGRRCWMFRDRETQKWFLHGWFD